jgi:hypothetical protein
MFERVVGAVVRIVVNVSTTARSAPVVELDRLRTAVPLSTLRCSTTTRGFTQPTPI